MLMNNYKTYIYFYLPTSQTVRFVCANFFYFSIRRLLSIYNFLQRGGVLIAFRQNKQFNASATNRFSLFIALAFYGLMGHFSRKDCRS